MAVAVACSLAGALAAAGVARATFPYPTPSGPPSDYTQYRLPAGANKTPNDFTGGTVWKFASTPEDNNLPANDQDSELHGVRGAHIADSADVDYAWRTTTGRPDVLIAVLDSGIKWNDAGDMKDLRAKVRLNRGELPKPRHTRSTPLESGVDCSKYRDAYDANGDGAFNVFDYACDPRVNVTDRRRSGPKGMLVPEDVTIAFSDGSDQDRNGFVDDIAGWDFLDNDNDPYDDVQYGHGTGEAKDSNAEADNGGDLGSCPSCMVMPLRVGDSFVADIDNFGQAALYAVDSGALVIQEALGALNNSSLGRRAVDYAYNHGVAVIASAADEAAQHHNWPSSLAHTIVVNSIRKYDETFTPVPHSYLQFNGCTNFSSKITISVPSSSCSSEATGRSAGMAGLVYSAALDAQAAGKLKPNPHCRTVAGKPCILSANEVRQLMASGTIGGVGQSDDVNFATEPEPSCTTAKTPACTDPTLNAPGNHLVVSPLANSTRYPARKGHDQFYGYGRVNAAKAVEAAFAGTIPPQVEITRPDWYALVDPRRPTAALGAQIDGRGNPYTCRVLVAPGSYPNNNETTDSPPGDFKQVPSTWCDGHTARTKAFSGTVANLDLADLKSRFPSNAGDFSGNERGTGSASNSRRPDVEPYGFVVRVVASSQSAGKPTTGDDRRNLYLHHDRDLLPGFPKHYLTDGASSPLLVDIDGDNRNELVFGTSDGAVHALRANGREVRGWPVHTDRLALHLGQRAYRSSAALRSTRGAILASVAAGDINGDGAPEVVAADMRGKLYVWSSRGHLLWKREAKIAWSGKPLKPFVNSRHGVRNRTQHGFIGSPVLADLDRNDHGRLEVIAAGMDRHVYAFNDNGSRVRGFPTIVVDPSKVASIDPRTQQVTFRKDSGEPINQGAIIDTPAVGDISGDKRPEIVVGTNEEYKADDGTEGPIDAAPRNSPSLNVIGGAGILTFANSRLYAIQPTGDRDGSLLRGPSPFVKGWPTAVGFIDAELLPVVGEGVTGAPAIAPVDCPSGGGGAKVGAMSAAGPSYVFNSDGTSCLGEDDGKHVTMQTDITGDKGLDAFAYSAVGHVAFGDIGGGTSLLAPAAGLLRAIDVAANEYQGGQDLMAVWDPTSGQQRTGFPALMNDLQFLTGPSVADIDGKAGEEVVGGSASLDLEAYDGSGNAVSGWPKLTSDWMVANPAIGSLGSAKTKSVIDITRSGTLLGYRTSASACSPGSWPRFHHDNANSGDMRRDAVSPGKPTGVRLRGRKLSFVAPGDDLMCGKAARYQIVGAKPAQRPAPVEPGSRQTITLSRAPAHSVRIRAVDDQGNVGRWAIVRR